MIALKNNQFNSVQQYFFEKLQDHYARNEIKIFLEMACEVYLGWSKMDLILNEKTPLTESEILKFVYLQKDLKAKKPIQYILNQGDFWGLKLQLEESVLIPRPETEELVAWVLEDFNPSQNITLVDVGTGSGCIPLALKSERPTWQIKGIDVDPKALAVAAKNGEKLKLEIEWQEKNILEATLEDFDIIVSNPPYIPYQEKENMDFHVTHFEPEGALFVPNDRPLLFYERLLELFEGNKAHTMYWEIHQDYVKELEILLRSRIFNFELKKDINNNPRMIKIEK